MDWHIALVGHVKFHPELSGILEKMLYLSIELIKRLAVRFELLIAVMPFTGQGQQNRNAGEDGKETTPP